MNLSYQDALIETLNVSLSKLKLEELRNRKPCRDYDADCDTMTLKQIGACQCSTCPLDDHTGVCIPAQHYN